MIAGLTPLSTTDFPGALSAVLYSKGCPWRCGYCHNSHLIDTDSSPALEWQDILNFLERRKGLVDAVVFSGGEPTLQRSLPSMIGEVRALGFAIGLHTSGAYPQRLSAVLPDVDWVGMDIKAPFDDYASITTVPGSGECAKASAMMLLESGVAYEFRTTVHPRLIDAGKIRKMAEALSEMGATNYRVQEFRPKGCLDKTLLDELETHAGKDTVAELTGLFP
jgi:anaerobic ribonucleoside-triphosphate reductase activating protein